MTLARGTVYSGLEMTNQATADSPAAPGEREQSGPAYPYAPSWIDRLMDAVERLPAPYWLTYLVIGLAQTALLQLLYWYAEPAKRYVVRPESAILPLWTWGVLALITALDHEVVPALHKFRHLLDDEDDDMRLLEYEATTMPARTVLLWSPVWLIVWVLIDLTTPLIQEHQDEPLLYFVSFVTGAIAFLIGSSIYIHTVHQLRLVNRLYSRMKKINVFHLTPVYAFSGLTAATAMGFIALIAVTQLLYPSSWVDWNIVMLFLFQLLLAAAIFVLPLRHAHLRIMEEKQRLLANTAQRMESTLKTMHKAMDDVDLALLDGHNKILAAIGAEREVLHKIPTWPWQPGTLRTVTTVLLVPIILFVVQSILRRWLGL